MNISSFYEKYLNDQLKFKGKINLTKLNCDVCNGRNFRIALQIVFLVV